MKLQIVLFFTDMTLSYIKQTGLLPQSTKKCFFCPTAVETVIFIFYFTFFTSFATMHHLILVQHTTKNVQVKLLFFKSSEWCLYYMKLWKIKQTDFVIN